jgi:hypothetical protein
LASQLRFEGRELEELLERVRREVGADAHIVEANRIRKGGVGGFFAKEGFEVIVDAPDGGAPRPTERMVSGNATGASGSSGRARAPMSVLDLAEETSASEREQVIDLSEPRVSTESKDFGSMLAELSRALDEEEADMPLPPPPMTVPRRTYVSEEDDAPVSPRAHYRRVTTERAAAAAPAPAPAPVYAEPQPAPVYAEPAAVYTQPVAPPAPMPAPVYAPEPAAPTRMPLAPTPDERLLALGLPPELTPSVAGGSDLRTSLVQRLATIPAPPMIPRSAGVLIAVVGIGTAPISLARRLADEMDLDPEHIVLSTPEPVSELSHPDEADAFRRSCRRRTEPTLIACSIGNGRAQLGWAHRMLNGLEPTVTWAVVEASVKPEDIAHRVGLLGGVDVLALTGIADTVSPAAVLNLEVPVGRLGSTPATPAAWADLLMQRLER